MPTTNVMEYCIVRKKNTLHIEQKINHVLQLLLSIVTAGLWLIVWALLAFFHDKKTQCTVCGHNKGFMNDIMTEKFRSNNRLKKENSQEDNRKDTLLMVILFIVLILILGFAIIMVEI